MSERPGEFEPRQVRTLQRQIRRWRAQHGPRQEVVFPQEHVPRHLGAFDFTYCGELAVTIAGVHFVHLVFQCVLARGGWRYFSLVFTPRERWPPRRRETTMICVRFTRYERRNLLRRVVTVDVRFGPIS